MVRLGFSPCPNDTFIFYALANRKIDTQGIDFNLLVEDVETLNQLALKNKADVTKVSCHAFAYVSGDYQFLRAGGAFGRGCGPLLVAKEKYPVRALATGRIAIPGELTTAFLLLQLHLISSFVPRFPSYVVMPFREIMASVRDGRVEAGLIIHESRFTYHEYGLTEIVDLGEWWEAMTGLPIPLGVIIARRSLGSDIMERVEDLIRSSVKYAFTHREEALPFIKAHSQELSEEVIEKHISLYVNDYTLDIGDDGEAALKELLRRAHQLMRI